MQTYMSKALVSAQSKMDRGIKDKVAAHIQGCKSTVDEPRMTTHISFAIQNFCFFFDKSDGLPNYIWLTW